MIAHQQINSPERKSVPSVGFREPVPLETLSIVEQALDDMLHDLEIRAATRAAAAIEYDSWLKSSR